MTDFSALGIIDKLNAVIGGLGYDQPTPIQQQAIPLVLAGDDVLGLAQTGTGKTAAFGLPLIQKLSEQGKRAGARQVRSLILAPTRELVIQIADNLKIYACNSDLRILSVVGGASINMQVSYLAKGADILVATPGRLMDLYERDALSLDQVRILVLDEADQMLDLGFIHVLRQLAKLLPDERQTLLFSATMPKTIAVLSRNFQQDPKRVEVAPSGKTADLVEQAVHYLTSQNRVDFLKDCLAEHMDGVSVIFARTKRGAEKLKNVLVDAGFEAVSVHGNKSQAQRNKAIEAFKSGEAKILVATDVAARGIDISGVSHVYNYDLPEVAEIYVHRIGRTARAGASGIAVSFCRPVDMHLWVEIEKLLGKEIPVASGERHTAEAIKAVGAKPVRGQAAKGRGRDGRSAGGKGGGKRPASGARGNERSAGQPAKASRNARRTKKAGESSEIWNPLAAVEASSRGGRSSQAEGKAGGFVERSKAGQKGQQARKNAKRSASRRKAAARRMVK